MTTSTQSVSDFYSRFSASYTQYANGTSTLEEIIDLKACKADHPFSWSDLQTWQALQESIDAIILEKEKSGEPRALQLLDVGCGDGMWAIRIANYCLQQDIAIDVECLDLSTDMLLQAENMFSAYIKARKGTAALSVTYAQCDLTKGLAHSLRHTTYDLTLCLHTVLNHVPSEHLAFCIAELIEYSSGFLYFSVKPPFSRPTFYAAPMSEILHYERRDEHLYALDRKGHFHVVRSNLISCKQLDELLSRHPVSYDFVALDVLISRFLPDPRWLGDEKHTNSLPMDDLLALEARTGLNSKYLDFANHILAVVNTRQ